MPLASCILWFTGYIVWFMGSFRLYCWSRMWRHLPVHMIYEISNLEYLLRLKPSIFWSYVLFLFAVTISVFFIFLSHIGKLYLMCVECSTRLLCTKIDVCLEFLKFSSLFLFSFSNFFNFGMWPCVLIFVPLGGHSYFMSTMTFFLWCAYYVRNSILFPFWIVIYK